MIALIKRKPYVNNLDNSVYPYGDLFKDVSELDLFILLVTIDPPTL